MRREAPQPWAGVMTKQGFVYGGRPSIRQLAAAARAAAGSDSPSDAAVHKVVMGEVDKPEDGTVNALALALGRSAREVADWVGQVREVATPWTPPEVADRLTRRQREALDALIRVMVDDTEGGGGDVSAAPNTRAGNARNDEIHSGTTGAKNVPIGRVRTPPKQTSTGPQPSAKSAGHRKMTVLPDP